MDFSFASTALYYGLYLFGAGSIGYLLVRLSYPDIRLLDKDAKLGISAILGFFIMCVSLAFEWSAGHAGEFGLGLHSFQGLMPLFSCILVVLTFGIMKVYFFVNSPRMLTVGLPIHSASKAAKAMEAPVPEAQKKTGQAVAAASDAVAQALAARPAVAPLQSRPVASVTPQPSGLFGFIDLIFKKRVPQTEQKKQELIEVDVPIVQHIVGARPDARATAQKQPQVRLVSVDLSADAMQGKPSSPQKARGLPGRAEADANLPAPFVASLQEKEFAKAKADAGKKPQRTLQSSFESKAAPFVSGIAPEAPPLARTGKKQPAAAEGEPGDERGRKNYYDQKINELLSGFPADDTGRKAGPLPTAPEPVKKTRKEIEAESEMMIADLVPAAAQKAAAQAAEQQEFSRRRFYQQPVEEQTEEQQSAPESRRRLYARPGSIRVIAPRDVSETDEFADIISDIYSQLKSSSREDSLNESMKVNVPPSGYGAAKPQARQPAAKGKFDDLESELFGTGKPVAASAPEGGVFDQLSRISAVEGPAGRPQARESGLKSSSDMEFVHIGNEAGMGCPTCHQKNSRIVFCPYCGSGMCTNCSPNVRVDAFGFAYSCPKCGEEVHIRKKAAVPSASF